MKNIVVSVGMADGKHKVSILIEGADYEQATDASLAGIVRLAVTDLEQRETPHE